MTLGRAWWSFLRNVVGSALRKDRRRRGEANRPWLSLGSAAGEVHLLESRVLLSASPTGSEFRLNSHTNNSQGTPSVASDADGDFVAVWSSNTQDGGGYGIYAQRYSASGAALGSEFRVNSFTTGDQNWPQAAMDADGDFVVVWIDAGQDGSDEGIYAQRYSANGTAVGSEFRVNTHTSTRQLFPSVAMDADGDFVVTWHSYGQDGANYGIYAQRYSASGAASGSEFRVNTATTNRQSDSRVAMDADGDFVVVWNGFSQGATEYGIFAQRYSPSGAPLGSEFQVNSFTTDSQSRPTVAMDADGDFVVAWQSDGQDGYDYGIYAQRYAGDGTPQGTEFQVNSYTTQDQAAPWLAMDADGDFAIFWQSFNQDDDSFGVYGQHYAADGATRGTEFLVNSFTTDAQQNPAVAMDADGDFVVAWSSLSQDGSSSGVFAQRFDEVGPDEADDAGPIVSGLIANGAVFAAGAKFVKPLNAVTVQFSEDLNTTGGSSGANSVLNKANWELRQTVGIQTAVMPGVIDNIAYGLNGGTGKYEAVVTFKLSLPAAQYQLKLKETARDVAGNALDGDRNGQSGTEFTTSFSVGTTGPVGSEFRVNTTTSSGQTYPAMAIDADGDFVVVWTDYLHDGSSRGIFAQRYSATGTPLGSEFQVNSYTTNHQNYPQVAMDADGDFVVVWQNDIAINAQRYSATGTPLGSEFRVNSYTESSKSAPNVAMDADGDFVVTWSSYGQDGDNYGVYAQRYSANGTPIGSEWKVSTYTTFQQTAADVAIDADGDFVIVWSSLHQEDNSYDVYAQRYSSTGTPLGSELRVNTYTTQEQHRPSVAMDADGDFVVAWNSIGQDGSGYGVYFKRFSAAGLPLGSESLVNSTFTTNNQYYPSVSMDADGDFVVAWQSEENPNLDIYTQRYAADGSPLGSYQRVNTYTTNGQVQSSVAMDADGDFVVAWISAAQDGSEQGVYAQRYHTDTTLPYVTSIADNDPNNFVALNQIVTYTVSFSEAIEIASLDAADFGNLVAITNPGQNASYSLLSVNPVANQPHQAQVQVRITSTGVFQLQLVAGATIRDAAGNRVTTSSAINHHEPLTVDPRIFYLVSITDTDSNDMYAIGQTVTYTVTFSEPIDASTVTSADFGNAETTSGASFTVGSITQNPGNHAQFTVAVALNSGSVFRLRVNNLAGISDEQQNVGPSVAVSDDTPFTLDTQPLYLASASASAAAAIINQPITFTLTFNEHVDVSSISAADFENIGNATINFGTIAAVDPQAPQQIIVQVTPTTLGGISLRIKQSATINDAQGTPLDTSLPINFGLPRGVFAA